MTLTVLMVASAFPLTQVLLNASSPKGSSSALGEGAGSNGRPSGATANGALPFGPVKDGTTAGPDAPGHRPGVGLAGPVTTGSPVLDQVLGAANAMGLQVRLPDLPLDQLAPRDPLRPAILAWIQATGARVAPADLARELDRADALPQDEQRDLAIVVLSATQATLLQREALAALTPEQIAWLYAHPEIAQQLAAGKDTPETRYAAALAGLVDRTKSIEAALLVLEAVEATRGSLGKDAQAQAAKALASESLDPSTTALLQLLASAPSGASDAEKVRYAARVVAATTGVTVPADPAPVPFADAVQALADATHQVPDAIELHAALVRADALPQDLQDALSLPLLAQAQAIQASTPGHLTPTSQAEALVGLLVASARALPTLEKYHIYWRDAPGALRVGQWEPAQRAGWAVYHSALFASTRGDPVAAVQAGAILQGLDLPDATVQKMTLVDAYAAMVELRTGRVVNATLRQQVRDAQDALPPAVADAAALMLSGVVRSERLQSEAWARVTLEDRAWLLSQGDLTPLYTKPDITPEELATLARYTRVGDRVDREKLAAAEVVAMRATVEAKRLLDPVYATQSESVRTLTVWDALARLLPWRTASAQGSPCVGLPNVPGSPARSDCANDILLKLAFPLSNQCIGNPTDPSDTSCDDFNANNRFDNTMLVISGLESRSYAPRLVKWTFSTNCRSTGSDSDGPSRGATLGPVHVDPMTQEVYIDTPQGRIYPIGSRSGSMSVTCDSVEVQAPQLGEASVWIDLGGSDSYAQPVASSVPFMFSSSGTSTYLHLDVQGNDHYEDPTDLYLPLLPYQSQISFGSRSMNAQDGVATQGSASAGGVAILLDAGGDDQYGARGKSQGYAQWGLGALVDLGGNDEYAGRAFVQGASSSDMNSGLGLLLDLQGDDSYRATAGQGYGIGGILLDLAGKDRYVSGSGPQGLPIAHLDIIPGGNLTQTATRGDDRIWLDGPAALNVGLGIDVGLPTSLSSSDADHDGFNDFAEFVVGTDPDDAASTPQSDTLARVNKLATDADEDTFPDFVEKALGTDPQDPLSYPAGIPMGPIITLPLGLGQVQAGDVLSGQSNAEGSDKIIDLRLPLQSAGSIEYACTGPMFYNATDTGFGSLAGIGVGIVEGGLGYRPGSRGGAPTQGPCTMVTYHPNGDGSGQANLEDPKSYSPQTGGGIGPVSMQGANASTTDGSEQFNNFTFRIPAGILAVGDVVATNYTVDYFFVVDLGGDDHVTGRAGGPLPVITTPEGKTPTRYKNGFFAPSVVLNVDLDERGNVTTPAGALARVSSAEGAQGFDVYEGSANDTGDYAQGAFWGLLLDTGGDDRYTAGSASQGAEGGLLLDLAGRDAYTAKNLSQGAVYGGVAGANAPTLPEGGTMQDYQNTQGDAALRHATPGLLLDLGSERDVYKAGACSQGFGRSASSGSSSPLSTGILLDAGGDDAYDTAAARGTRSQGVAGGQGLGILLDLTGNDTYRAWTETSHGAIVSNVWNTSFGGGNSNPGAGLLLDLGGRDLYAYNDSFGVHDRTRARQDNLTIARGDLVSGSNHLYAAPGIHLDSESEATALANAVFHTGGSDFTNADEDGVATNGTQDLYVDLPAAGLAIGNANATNYTNEYALVIDFGGANNYSMNAGGLVPPLLYWNDATPTSETPSNAPYHNQLALFPVSLVLDVGTEGSRYLAPHGLVQGAGYFSVGIVADLGGNDTFVAAPAPIPALAASWMPQPIIADGSIGSTEWGATPWQDIALTGTRDPALHEPASIRIANDARNVYVAIRGHSSATITSPGSFSENLTLDLSVGHGDKWWVGDGVSGKTLVDHTRVEGLDASFCRPRDGYVYMSGKLNWTEGPSDGSGDVTHRNDTLAGCVLFPDGNFTLELVKPLRRSYPFQNSDLDLPYDPDLGYVIRELGLHIELTETTGANEVFVWPAGTARVDGGQNYQASSTANLSDELRDWGDVGLANLGQAGVAPVVTKLPALAQGAGIAGVGILAMLGETGSSATLVASDKSQGYGAVKGLGLVVDMGGSDDYSSNTMSLAAADANGIGAVVDLGGNDNYRCARSCLGNASDGSALAIFLDLGGDDQYNVTTLPARNARPCVAETSKLGCDPQTAIGTVHPWKQGQTGYGADILSDDAIRQIVANTVGNVLLGEDRVVLSVHKVNEKGECVGSVPTRHSHPLLTGVVCLVATLNFDETETPGSVKVESVDFLVDRTRIVTVGKPLEDDATTFAAKVDVTGLRDGVANLTASAILRVDVQQHGTVLFYDRSASAREPVFIDNPASGTLCVFQQLSLPPGVTDPCETNETAAYFSPIASDPAYGRSLTLNWSVSHEAGEDNLTLAHGWTPEDEGRNVPCDTRRAPAAGEDITVLCDIIPLYFKQGRTPADWNTERGDDPPAAPSTVKVQTNGLDGIFDQKSIHFTTPLIIMKDQGFHAYLSERQPILPATYNTSLRITVLDALDHPVLYRGENLTLADEIFVAGALSPTPAGLCSALDCKPVTNAVAQVGNTAGGIVFPILDGPLDGILNTIDTVCGNDLFEVVDGGLNAASLRFCHNDYSGENNGLWVPVIGVTLCNPSAAPSGVYRTISQAIYDKRPCRPTLNQTAHEAARDYGPVIDDALSPLTDAGIFDSSRLDPILKPVPTPRLNWTDLVVDRVHDAPALEEQSAPCVIDLGDRVQVQPTCAIKLEIAVIAGVVTDGAAGGAGDLRRTYDTEVRDPVNQQLDGPAGVANHPVDEQTNRTAHNTLCPVDRRACGAANATDTVNGVVPGARPAVNTTGYTLNTTVNNVLNLGSLPFALFRLGTDLYPSRLDIKVPVEPTTNASLNIERASDGTLAKGALTPSGKPAGSPVPVIGDWPPQLNNDGAPGAATADAQTLNSTSQRYVLYNWTSDQKRFTQHSYRWEGDGCDDGSCPDGVYVAHLKVQDGKQLDSGAAFEKNQTIVLDRTPPESHLLTSGYAGSAMLDGNALPLVWSVDNELTPPAGQGSGLKQVWLWYHKGSGDFGNLSEARKWVHVTSSTNGGPFPASVNTFLDKDLDSTKTDYYFVTIAEDRVGNIEGLVRGDIPDLDLLLADMDADHRKAAEDAIQATYQANTLQDRALRAFYSKLLHAQYDHIFVDPTKPARPTTSPAAFVTGGRPLNYRGVESYFVRAGAPITFQACAGDLQSGVRQVNFVFDHVDPATGNVTTRSFNGGADGSCGAYTRFGYSGWASVDTDKTLFPDGAWTVTAEVFDLAGNRLQIPIANVVLDSKAPDLQLQAPEFPPGQSAVKPGDRLTLRMIAADELGLDEPALSIDATHLSTSGRILSCQAPGAGQECIRQVRRNGVAYEEVSFKVDRPDLKNATYALAATALDNAGNTVTRSWNITVDASRFEIVNASIRATGTTHNSTIIRWTTTEPTSSAVRFGPAPTDMKTKTATNLTPTREHEVLVDGLQASTRYFLRVVSSTPGGFTLESDTVEAVTDTALFLEAVSPKAGSAVSGAVPVRFHGGLLDATSDFVTYTLEAQSAPGQPWQFVTTLSEQGTEHELTFNSTRYLDGSAYRLRITATFGHDTRVAGIGPLLSDNTPPEVSVVGPLYATNDTTPSVTAEARDNLAGFNGTTAAALTIDGAPAANVVATPSTDGLRITYDVPSALPPGLHTFQLDVKDQAGNVAPNVWQVSVDGDAPRVQDVAVQYAPGPSAAKLGGTVTINVTATDASGIASIVADATEVGGLPAARFTRVVGTDHWVATIPVTASAQNATLRVPLVVTDRAGNSAPAGADVTIDNVAPRIQGDVRTVELGLTTATIVADANEPVLLVVTATSKASPPVTAATSEPSLHPTLALKGLLPSREYQYQVVVLDRAGNEARASGKFQTQLDLKAPTKVAKLEVEDMLNGTLRLSWSAATDDVGIAFYRVYRVDAGTAAYRILQEVDGLATYDPNLPLETHFTYKVVAVDHGSNEGPASDAIRASATAVPSLRAGLVTPTAGTTATLYQYIVTYTSPSGVKPLYVHAIVDGAAHTMRLLDPAAGTYVYETTMPPHKRDAPHAFSFEASDGRYTARFPEDGSTLRGPLVSGDAASAGAQGGVAGLFGARSVPAGGLVGMGLAVLVAAGIITLVIRKKREGSK